MGPGRSTVAPTSQVNGGSQPKFGSDAKTDDTTNSPTRHGQIYYSQNEVLCGELHGFEAWLRIPRKRRIKPVLALC